MRIRWYGAEHDPHRASGCPLLADVALPWWLELKSRRGIPAGFASTKQRARLPAAASALAFPRLERGIRACVTARAGTGGLPVFLFCLSAPGDCHLLPKASVCGTRVRFPCVAGHPHPLVCGRGWPWTRHSKYSSSPEAHMSPNTRFSGSGQQGFSHHWLVSGRVRWAERKTPSSAS